MKKLLVICGPTAVGKTSLAIKLAKLFNGELVSADSRQVYKDMDVGTGKDIPIGSVFKKVNKKVGGYYIVQKVRIWGYDLVSPKENFSVAQYSSFAREVIKNIHKRNKLPILVGGTGFYIKSVLEGIDTVKIPQSKALRKKLEKLSKEELFEKIAILDAVKAGSFNQSDKNNPRRLMRAIEIATWKLNNLGVKKTDSRTGYDSLIIGLTLEKKDLYKKIKERVQKMNVGVKKEILGLLKSGVKWSDQSMTSLGYRQWKNYFDKKESSESAFAKWLLEEQKYSKRQMTWFNKYKEVSWFKIKEVNWQKNVEKLVKKWYSSD